MIHTPHQLRLCSSDDTAHAWLFWTAVEDVNRGHIKPTDQLYQLKALQDVARKEQYLKACRQLQINRKTYQQLLRPFSVKLH